VGFGWLGVRMSNITNFGELGFDLEKVSGWTWEVRLGGECQS
jgi:hypothetical protein